MDKRDHQRGHNRANVKHVDIGQYGGLRAHKLADKRYRLSSSLAGGSAMRGKIMAHLLHR